TFMNPNPVHLEALFQVLLCCDRLDADHVRIYRNFLRSKSIDARLIIDALAGGTDVEFELKRLVQGAQLVLVFLSTRSVKREGPLQKAILTALDLYKEKPPGKVFIIPVRLDECETHLRLAELHRIDVFESSGWEKLSQQIIDHQEQYEHDLSTSQQRSNKTATRTMRGPQTKSASDTTVNVPVLTFPEAIKEFIYAAIPRKHWKRLDQETRRFITTLGCKLEPIIQIAPLTPTTLIIGFECL